jgi:hypothetical protein
LPDAIVSRWVTFAALLAPAVLILTVSNYPPVLAIAGVIAIVVVAWTRRPAPVEEEQGALAVQRGTLGWVLVSGGFWLASLLIARINPAAFPLLMWAAVAAGAVAVGEAYAIQRQRVDTGRSRTPGWVLVLAAIILLLVQPLLFPATALVVALLDRRETVGSR